MNQIQEDPGRNVIDDANALLDSAVEVGEDLPVPRELEDQLHARQRERLPVVRQGLDPLLGGEDHAGRIELGVRHASDLHVQLAQVSSAHQLENLQAACATSNDHGLHGVPSYLARPPRRFGGRRLLRSAVERSVRPF